MKFRNTTEQIKCSCHNFNSEACTDLQQNLVHFSCTELLLPCCLQDCPYSTSC